MRLSLKPVMFFIASSLCFSATASQYTEQLQQQLNQCRAEYKEQATQAQASIDEAISRRRFVGDAHINSLKKQLQESLNYKAQQCKRIKQDLQNAPAVEQQRKEQEQKKLAAKQRADREKQELINRIWTAPSIKKSGPVLRCLQLGQTAQEFTECGKQLGYSIPELKNNVFLYNLGISRSELAIVLGTELHNQVVAQLSEKDYHVETIWIYGTQFWGTNAFSDQFLAAMMTNYGFILLPVVQEVNGQIFSYLKHEGDGWQISVVGESNPPLVTLEKMAGTQDFQF